MDHVSTITQVDFLELEVPARCSPESLCNGLSKKLHELSSLIRFNLGYCPPWPHGSDIIH